MKDQPGYGQLSPYNLGSEYNRHVFVINQILARVRTMVLVKVVAFSAGSGDPSIPGTVTVQPIVNMTDGQGNATPHGTISNVPVWRLQGGGNAIIVEPAVDDVGWMAVADRDISAAKANDGAISNPGSLRQFDLADGVYMGGLFGAAPTQWIRMDADGITAADLTGNVITTSSTGITLTPKAGLPVTVAGQLIVQQDLIAEANFLLSGAFKSGVGGTYTGDLKVAGNVIAGFGGGDQVGLQTHSHHQGNDSRGDTEQPTAAPTAGT